MASTESATSENNPIIKTVLGGLPELRKEIWILALGQLLRLVQWMNYCSGQIQSSEV